jgi:hypothetical protein
MSAMIKFIASSIGAGRGHPCISKKYSFIEEIPQMAKVKIKSLLLV